MKKRLPIILVIVAVIAIALIYIFTRHTHTFAEATCTTAKICECGEIEGEPLGHTWVDATTENPKTCSFCGLTEGEALKSDPSIPTFNAKQGTVEGYEVTETEETDNSLTGGTDVTLGEDDYKGEDFEEASPEETPAEQPTVDTTGKTNVVVQDGITYWDGITDEEIAQQIIADYLREHAQDNQVDVPGGTPYDPSQDGQIVIGDNPALAGDYIN